MKTRIIIVGGFLGAGKTTLLWESARKIGESGKRAGLITNDQASELVDTAFLQRGNGTVFEVSGSCFCCNFNGFTEAIAQAQEKQCEIIIAEPVGSCTDLSATILQPLKHKFGNELMVAPLTVLADPGRLVQVLDGGTSGLHESAAYIFEKQLEEADIILINKTDLLEREALDELIKRAMKEWPNADIRSISAKTGEGLADWLEEVLSRSDSGNRLADIDYDIYAEGEAVLGWLNAGYSLKSKGTDWDELLRKLTLSLGQRFETANLPVGHVKLLMETESGFSLGNLTGKSNSRKIRGEAGAGDEAKLTVNARVETSPENLQRIVSEEISQLIRDTVKVKKIVLKCLKPGRPNPTYRYDSIV